MDGASYLTDQRPQCQPIDSCGFIRRYCESSLIIKDRRLFWENR